MILFKTLRYKNFLSSGNEFTEIPLNVAKTTLIIGENGSGKSTMLDALFFALYGKPFRNINKPQLLNTITNRELLVEVEFSIGKRNYLIRRGIKPIVFEIFVDGQLLAQDSLQKDYQESLESNILKISSKSFAQIVVLGMANFMPFMALPAAARREFIEDLLDLQIFSQMNVLLKERVLSNSNQMNECEWEIKRVLSNIELQEQHLRKMNENNSEAIRSKEQKIKELKTKIKEDTILRQTKNKALKELNENAKLDTECISKLEKSLVLLKQLNGRMKTVDREISFYEQTTQCPTCQQSIDEKFKENVRHEKTALLEKIKGGIQELEEKIALLSKQKKEQEEFQQSINDLRVEISKISYRIDQNVQNKTSLETEIHELSKKKTEILDDKNLRAFEQEKQDLENKRIELERTRETIAIALGLLKDGGIKASIIRQYIPKINSLIATYLAALDFFVQFEVDETFKETIRSRYRDEFSYNSFSQGEKLRIDLALMFTWRAVAKMRSSLTTNLLIMDEILDSSLDMNGVEEFLKIITALSGETNTFIISHKSDQMIDKFDTVIKFHKIKNFSKIEAIT